MRARLSRPLILLLALLLASLWWQPQWWIKPDRRAYTLFNKGDYAQAAALFEDPAWRGAALYHNADFKEAAAALAPLRGPNAAFNAGNAWLMAGQYPAAIASYNDALDERPNMTVALDNRAIAQARLAALRVDDDDRAEDASYSADEIRYDAKANPKTNNNETGPGGPPGEAAWLRNVRTSPADFLRQKFAYQAEAGPTPAASPQPTATP